MVLGRYDVTLEAGVLHHVAPVVVGVVVGAADRVVLVVGPAVLAAAHAPWCARLQVLEAGLAVATAHLVACRVRSTRTLVCNWNGLAFPAGFLPDMASILICQTIRSAHLSTFRRMRALLQAVDTVRLQILIEQAIFARWTFDFITGICLAMAVIIHREGWRPFATGPFPQSANVVISPAIGPADWTTWSQFTFLAIRRANAFWSTLLHNALLTHITHHPTAGIFAGSASHPAAQYPPEK